MGLLLARHTHETGQKFTPDAVACIWHLSQGCPWLVNALAEVAGNLPEDDIQYVTDLGDVAVKIRIRPQHRPGPRHPAFP